MWTTEVCRTTTASPAQIWKYWNDVKNWSVWDDEVESSTLFGEFKIGSKGILRPIGGPKTKFEIIDCDNLKSFTSRSSLPLCKIDFIHTMTKAKNGELEVNHQIVMTGLMTFLFSRIVGNNIKIKLPTAVDKLIELAEK